MPRDKSDVWRDIGLEKMERGGTGSYSGGVCIVCDKTMKEGSEKVLDIYDIHYSCYYPDAVLKEKKDRLMELLNELERMIT